MATSQLAESLSNLADDLEKSCERQDARNIIELLNEASSEIDGFVNGSL